MTTSSVGSSFDSSTSESSLLGNSSPSGATIGERDVSKYKRGNPEKWSGVAKNVGLIIIGLGLAGIGIALLAHGISPHITHLLGNSTNLKMLAIASPVVGVPMIALGGRNLYKSARSSKEENLRTASSFSSEVEEQPHDWASFREFLKNRLKKEAKRQGKEEIMTLFQLSEYVLRYTLKNGELLEDGWGRPNNGMHEHVTNTYLQSSSADNFVDAKKILEDTKFNLKEYDFLSGLDYCQWPSSS